MCAHVCAFTSRSATHTCAHDIRASAGRRRLERSSVCGKPVVVASSRRRRRRSIGRQLPASSAPWRLQKSWLRDSARSATARSTIRGIHTPRHRHRRRPLALRRTARTGHPEHASFAYTYTHSLSHTHTRSHLCVYGCVYIYIFIYIDVHRIAPVGRVRARACQQNHPNRLAFLDPFIDWTTRDDRAGAQHRRRQY